MLWNIIDHRERPYRWKMINAIIDAVEHNNPCTDADEAPYGDYPIHFDALEAVSVSEAIRWAMEQPSPVTLYLYDEGKGFSDAEGD